MVLVSKYPMVKRRSERQTTDTNEKTMDLHLIIQEYIRKSQPCDFLQSTDRPYVLGTPDYTNKTLSRILRVKTTVVIPGQEGRHQ